MAINTEHLLEKLKGLKEQQQQVLGNLNAVAGAVQLLEQLIKEAGADIPETREDQP
jgi:hypothetical protein